MSEIVECSKVTSNSLSEIGILSEHTPDIRTQISEKGRVFHLNENIDLLTAW